MTVEEMGRTGKERHTCPSNSGFFFMQTIFSEESNKNMTKKSDFSSSFPLFSLL